MPNNFTKLFQQLNSLPCVFNYQSIRKLLSEKELDTLTKLGILKSGRPLDEIVCQSCENGHFVKVQFNEGNNPFYICQYEDTQRSYIKADMLKIWEFDIWQFLDYLTNNLGITKSVKVIDNRQYYFYIGNYSFKNKGFTILYSITGLDDELIHLLEHSDKSLENVVVLVNQNKISSLKSKSPFNMFTIDISQIVSNDFVIKKDVFDKLLSESKFFETRKVIYSSIKNNYHYYPESTTFKYKANSIKLSKAENRFVNLLSDLLNRVVGVADFEKYAPEIFNRNPKNKMRTLKDILHSIKRKLGVTKGEFFVIEKLGNGFKLHKD